MSADRLPCGADIDDLVAQVAEGGAADRTPHQTGCPHCQAALSEYDQAFAPVRELVSQPVHVPDAVLEEVLRRIRGSLSDPAYGVLPGPLGVTRIAGQIVALTARTATEQVPGVRVALARTEPAATGPDTGITAGVAGTSTALRITVAAAWGEDLHALADRIRGAVAHAVRTTTGLRPVEIDIVIDDVFNS
jgi:uncharacterized alkaline shock family protein YloU